MREKKNKTETEIDGKQNKDGTLPSPFASSFLNIITPNLSVSILSNCVVTCFSSISHNSLLYWPEAFNCFLAISREKDLVDAIVPCVESKPKHARGS